MVWDDTKATGDDITADEWNTHVADQKARGGFNTVDVFEAGGTFDATDIDSAFVEAVGGGGGGGGVTGVSGSGVASGGGSGAGYAAAYVDLSGTTSVSITVGSGGSGGVDGSESGGGGENSSFGTLVEAGGGVGGPGSNDTTTGDPSGGDGITGDITITGENSQGSYEFAETTSIIIPADGGDSVYGLGSSPRPVDSLTTGSDGNGYGAGGSGAGALDINGSTASGGNGSGGVVFVHYRS